MKKIFLSGLLVFFILIGLYGQSLNTGNTEDILFIYEESNESLDPWLMRFRSEFIEKGIPFEEHSAAGLESVDLAPYNRVFIYGAVMAFTLSEPIRDWLKTDPDLSGKDVVLFVTANRWFLDKYTNQLLTLIEKNDGTVIDSISSATKELTGEEKTALAGRGIEFYY